MQEIAARSGMSSEGEGIPSAKSYTTGRSCVTARLVRSDSCQPFWTRTSCFTPWTKKTAANTSAPREGG